MIDFSSSPGANLFAGSPSSVTMNPSAGSGGGVNQQASSPSGPSLLSQFGRSTSSASSASSMFSLGPLGPPPLDLNEFPSLGNAASIASFAQASSTGRPPYVGMVKDNVPNSTVVNEFNIQHEDFPALPGAPGGGGARGGGGGGIGPDGHPSQSTTPNSASIQAILNHPFGPVSASTDLSISGLSSNNPLASLSQQLSSVINTSLGGGLGVGVVGGGLSSLSSSATSGGMQQQLNPNNSSSSSSNNPSSLSNQVPSSPTLGQLTTRPDSTESSGGGGGQSGSGQLLQQQQQSSSQQQQQQLSNTSMGGSGSGGGASGKKQSLTGSTSGVHLTKDGHIANIPAGMLTDQYGMAGLVALLQSTEQNQNLFSLSIGCDITSINLNLNSKERIYQTYPGPWNEKQLKPYEIDFPVPTEYLINQNIRDKIADIKYSLYSEDLLFFLFYFFAGETMQLHATNELHSRDWRFHKDEGVWLRRQGTPPVEKNQTFERGSYIYFDPHNWMKMQKDMTVEYDRLVTTPPGLPGGVPQQAPQQQQQQQ